MRSALALILLAGCGAVGEQPFPGLRLPDPASWEDAGPIVVCEGSARLGRPDDDSVGFCGGVGGTDASCATDGDCDSRERCTCGRCAVRPCDTTEECAAAPGARTATVCSFADRRCDRPCAVDGDCAGNERCLPGRGVCRGLCATSAECQRGERCQLSPLTGEGACVAVTCGSDDDCGGARCLVGRRPADLREPLLVGETLWLERRDLITGAPSIVRAVATAPISVETDAAALPSFSLAPGVLVSGRGPAILGNSDGSALLVFADAAQPLILRARVDADGAATVDQTPIGPGEAPALARLSDGSVALVCADNDGLARRDAPSADAPFGPAAIVLTAATVERAGLWESLGALESPSLEAVRDAAGAARLRLWFAAVGVESGPSRQFGAEVPTPANASIGLATSADEHGGFVPFDANPVFDRVIEFLNHPGEREPAIAPTAARGTAVQWMVYRRTSADGTRSDGIAAARSPARPPLRD